MGLFDFFRRKKDPLKETTEKIFNEIFPGGKKDIETGAKVLQHLLRNKIDTKTAVQIYSQSAAFAKITEQFDKERLRSHLGGYALHYFTESELNSYYEFLTAFRNTTKPITTVRSSGDFYDKIFDSLLETGVFNYPYSSENKDEMTFAIFGDGTTWLNKNKQESQIAIYVYLWLRYVAKKNKTLHTHLIKLMNDEKTFFEREKTGFIKSVIQNNSTEQLFSDPKAVNHLFNRARAYKNWIGRLTENLLSFYAEYEDKIDHIISRINKEYSETPKISRTDLTIQDIDHIFLRDMLSGKELK